MHGPTLEEFEQVTAIPEIVSDLLSRRQEEDKLDPLEKQKLLHQEDVKLRHMERESKLVQMTEDFQKQFKNMDNIFLTGDVKVPKIVYLANKAEDGYEGDILGDFYLKFPHAAEDPDMEPVFISAEHGDGFTDLYAAIQKHIPADHLDKFENRKEKRLERFFQLKETLMDEVIDFKF